MMLRIDKTTGMAKKQTGALAMATIHNHFLMVSSSLASVI
jgi:hypothetical protein